MKRFLVKILGAEFLVEANYGELRTELLGLRLLISQAIMLSDLIQDYADDPNHPSAVSLKGALDVALTTLEPFKKRFKAVGLPFTPDNAREKAEEENWSFEEVKID